MKFVKCVQVDDKLMVSVYGMVNDSDNVSVSVTAAEIVSLSEKVVVTGRVNVLELEKDMEKDSLRLLDWDRDCD